MKRLLLSSAILLILSPTPAMSGAEPFIGEIMLIGGSYCPEDWAEADGRLLSVATDSALFVLYGCRFGGDCVANFALPDLRGRAPIGAGTGPGLTARARGELGGQESVELLITQIPAHTHSLSNVTLKGTVQASSSAGTTNVPSGKALSDSNRTSLYSDGSLDSTLAANSVSVAGQSGDAVAATGGNQAHNNMPPFLTLRYCVALEGIFPPQQD